MKAATDNRKANTRGCVPIKLYLQVQAVGLVVNPWSEACIFKNTAMNRYTQILEMWQRMLMTSPPPAPSSSLKTAISSYLYTYTLVPLANRRDS